MTKIEQNVRMDLVIKTQQKALKKKITQLQKFTLLQTCKFITMTDTI